MQTYPFSFTAQRGSTTIPAQGDLFVYESAENAGGELRVKVKPDNAGEITLRPGQRFRSHTRVTAWNITSYTGTEVVSGSFIIGEGEFDDANTVNTFKLDGTFVNTVKVNNPAIDPVNVRLISTEVQEGVVKYNKAYVSENLEMGATQVMAPGENVNGALSVTAYSNSANVTLIAAAVAPVKWSDGDLLLYDIYDSNLKGNRPIFEIKAGLGLWVFRRNSAGIAMFNSLIKKL